MSTREPITHELKCHHEPFAAVKSGAKSFEWRKDDRDYRVGDTLRLMEWDPTVEVEGIEGEPPATVGYTGHVEYRRVTYIIREGFSIPPGYCIMCLAELEAQPSQTEDLDARAREWLRTEQNTADTDDLRTTGKEVAFICAAFARSLAQPPSSEVVEAGNAMRKAVCDLIIIENAMEDDDGKFHLDDLNNAWLMLAQAAMSWDAALAAHPKDPTPTVDQIMDVVNPLVIWDGTSLSPNGGDAEAECRTRLKTLLP